jgi:hypothetical protein
MYVAVHFHIKCFTPRFNGSSATAVKQKAGDMLRSIKRTFMTVRLRFGQLAWHSATRESDRRKRKAGSKWYIKANDQIFDPGAAKLLQAQVLHSLVVRLSSQTPYINLTA